MIFIQLPMPVSYTHLDVYKRQAVSSPLPSTDILETTLNHFHVKNNEVLLISSFAALNEAASKMRFNIIYCEDLVEADTYEKETSYKIVHNLFEVLNTLLFDQYDEAEIYSPILGMSSDMTPEELTQVKDCLLYTSKKRKCFTNWYA